MYERFGNRMHRKKAAVLQKTPLGETAVSFHALEQIALCTVKTHAEVKSCRIKVNAIGSSVWIGVRVVTDSSINLLTITHSLQDEINASIIMLCGTPVGIVDVTVDQEDDRQKKA